MEEKRNIFTQMAVVFSVWRKNENKKCLKCYAVSFSPFLWFSTFAFIIFSILDLSTNLKQSFFFYIIIVVCTQWFPSKKEKKFFAKLSSLQLKQLLKFMVHMQPPMFHILITLLSGNSFIWLKEREKKNESIECGV